MKVHIPPRVAKALAAAAMTTTIAGAASIATAPPAAAAWEDCGDYTCTLYFSRAETRAVSNYLDAVNGYGVGAGDAFCDWAGYQGGRIGALAGVGCAAVVSRYDWRDDARSAVNDNACFQVAYRNTFWGKVWPSTGETNHPSYCFD